MTRAGTTVTFTGGLRTPTGTRFHVAVDRWRACFDLGLAFTPATAFFDGRVAQRPERLLADLLALGMAPALPGLYRQDAVASSSLSPGPDDRTAVFISHLHLDHMSLLAFVADEIPIYMSPRSAELLGRLEKSALNPLVGRPVQTLEPGRGISLGPLQVMAMAVDHDVPGALAFLVDTPDGTLVYSGDLRSHGYQATDTEAFVNAAAARRPRALVMETTRMGEEPVSTLSETAVIDEMAQVAGGTAGLVFVVPYPRNVERIMRLPEVARRTGRQLVLEPALARLLEARLGTDAQVFGDSVAGLEGCSAAAVRSDPGRFLVQISYAGLARLIDLRPPAGSVLIHSDGEPLSSYDPAHANLLRWLSHFNVAYQVVRSSGHAPPGELVRIASAIAADVTFPLHGSRPDLLIVPGSRAVLPVADVAYHVDGSAA